MKFENLSLPQLMLLWGSMESETNRVAELIKGQVLQLKQTQTIADIRATYGQGKGSYDYQTIAEGMAVDKELIEQYSPRRTDWRLICEDIEVHADIESKQKFFALQKEHFTPGKEQVRLSIVKPKEDK